MIKVWKAAVFAIALVGIATPVAAQWNGFYLGGFAGVMLQNGDPEETVTFDTNLDGLFEDTVRTVTGANAFAPGFCPGLATGPTPASACEDDENGFILGGRVGYDVYVGGAILGIVADLSWPEVTDGVSAFSTTPAFYAFARDLHMLAGLRGRLGAGNDHVLAYATGGVALGRVEHRFTTSNGVNTFVPIGSGEIVFAPADEPDREGAWGYQAGGGVEIWIANNVALSAEYLFTSLDDRDDAVVRARGPAPPGNPFLLANTQGTDFRRSDHFSVHAITAGVVYRF